MVFYDILRPDLVGEMIPADRAYDMMQTGELTLIDVRRPDEWASTGSPEGAVQLDMRRDDFDDALRAIRAERPDTAVAVICMRGVRSARLANRLVEAGFDDIRDVPEGMLGSSFGPGWLARGLPITQNG